MSEKNILQGFKFFPELTPKALNKLAAKSEELEFDTDDIVFRFEETAEHFYGLIEGEVELTLVFTDRVLKTEVEYEQAVHARMVDQKRQIVVDYVHPAQVFGWASIIGSGKRTVTARCTEPSRVFAIPAAELMALFEADPTMGYLLMRRMADIISKRLKNRTEKLIETWVEAFDVGEI